MKVYEIRDGFGLENLRPGDRPDPRPGHGEVLLRVRAVSLNYRDLMVVKGQYNPRMALPPVPCSDAAAGVAEAGPGVSRVKVGQRVCGLFMPAWLDGPLDDARAKSALGGSVDGVLSQ